MTLKSKVISGVIWISLSKVLLKFINFVIMIVLARLLEPADFGLVALAMVFVTFFEITRDLGMESALIHYEGDEHDKNLVYSTAFSLYPVVAILLYLVSYFFAPYVAAFFGNENVEAVIRALLLTIVVWSFGTLPRTLLVKNLDFKKMFFPQVLPKISYGVVAILMAYAGYGVWSLVVGRIVLEITSVIAYWKSLQWRPSLVFSKEKAIELLSFGKFVAAAGIITFLLSSVDVALIGKVLGTESLGYYTIAMSIAGMFTVQASLMLSQVVFPTYSKMQNDIYQLGDSHFKVIKLFSIFVFPATFGIILISKYFVETIYGTKWLPAVHILQILCIYGLFTSFNKINSTVFLAVGKPKIMAKISYVHLFILAILIYPLTMRYGIYGTSVAVTISVVVSTLYSFSESCKILQKTIRETFYSTWVALKGSLLMIIAILLLQRWIVGASSEIMLIITVSTGFIVYAFYFAILYREDIINGDYINKLMAL